MTTEPFDVLHPISGEPMTERRQAVATVSVVVPCCGQLEYIRLCVASLLRYSRPPVELIFVDLESMDGTAEYVAGIMTAATVPVRSLRVSGDAEFAGALNAGVSIASGEFIVLLDNDTIVTPHWLEHMIALAESSPMIGVVGAMSNGAESPQSVGSVPYRLSTKQLSQSADPGRNGELKIETESVCQFAQQWTEKNRGQWFQTDRLATFCLMFRRAVLDRIGPLQPQGYYCIDADAVFRAVRESGFSIACCRDLFIHQFASRPGN